MRKVPIVTLALALLLASVGGPAWAEADGAAVDETGDKYKPVTVFGMQVFIDTETGQLRPPTAAEAAEMSAMMQQMFGGAQQSEATAAAPTLHADGMLSAELDFGLLDFSVARTLPDGSLTTDCAGDLEQAKELVLQPAGNTPQEEE